MNLLRENVGQLFMIGVQGEALSRDERLIIEQCGFGGFILFSHNCREPRQILSLCRALWETEAELPPFYRHRPGGRPSSSSAKTVHPLPGRCGVGALVQSELERQAHMHPSAL